MRKPTTTPPAPSFAALVQSFFTEHLVQQRAVSPRTVATYRDAFVLFLNFAAGRLHELPTAIRLEEITLALILAFLDYLEHERGNATRSRNARLAALRAFLKFAAHRELGALHVVEQALGVPMKRFERFILLARFRPLKKAILLPPANAHITSSSFIIDVPVSDQPSQKTGFLPDNYGISLWSRDISVAAGNGQIADFAPDNATFDTNTVPEPASLALIGAALLGVGFRRRKP